MPKSIITYACPECGASVTRRIDGYNRADADSRAAWAEQHPGLCAACYRKQRRYEDNKAIAGLRLPDVTGASHKQVAYALDLRAAYAAAHRDDVNICISCRDDPHKLAIAIAEASKLGITADQHLRNMLQASPLRGYYVAYIIATSTDARELIDVLRGRY